MNIQDDPQVKVIRDFDYNPITGILTRKCGQGLNAGRGSTGQISNNGYITFTWEGKSYLAAHLIWLYCYGDWPTQEIDHVNRIKTDNRLENLRLVTRQENCLNRSCKKGIDKGITPRMSKGNIVFMAEITRNKKHYYLGTFKTVEEARQAVKNFGAITTLDK